MQYYYLKNLFKNIVKQLDNKDADSTTRRHNLTGLFYLRLSVFTIYIDLKDKGINEPFLHELSEEINEKYKSY